ncbi:unnamed protein product, partial [Closterium sp. NIES-54]
CKEREQAVGRLAVTAAASGQVVDIGREEEDQWKTIHQEPAEAGERSTGTAVQCLHHLQPPGSTAPAPAAPAPPASGPPTPATPAPTPPVPAAPGSVGSPAPVVTPAPPAPVSPGSPAPGAPLQRCAR